MQVIPSVRQAVEAPSTPRTCKRPRLLERHLSDEKESAPIAIGANQSDAATGRTSSCAGVATTPDIAHVSLISQRHNRYPLVGREEECSELDNFLSQSLNSGMGNGRCLYISGAPGTGKTCSVMASIANFRRSAPDTQVLEVNCMDLTQRSVPGVLLRLMEKMGSRRCRGQSMQRLANDVACQLSSLGTRVAIVVDEVDQLVNRSAGKAAANSLALETLFAVPRLPGAPAVAIIAIANAVDLLERTAVRSANANCGTMLFEAYSKDQLKDIVTSRVKEVEGGEAALKALGPIKVELKVRQVAKECGDCRQVLSLIEEAILEAKSVSSAEE